MVAYQSRILPITVLLITRHSQAQRLQRVRRQIAGHAQTVVALITQDRAMRCRAEDAVDRSAVITFPCQSLLGAGNGAPIGKLVLIGRLVCTLTVVIGPFVNPGIITVLIGIIVIGGVVIVGIAVPREESKIENEP